MTGKDNRSKAGNEQDSKELKINVDGKITTVLPGTKYKVVIDFQGMKHEITAYPSGKIRKNYIKFAEGDEIIVEMSPAYDIDVGRIVWKKSSRRPVPASLESSK